MKKTTSCTPTRRALLAAALLVGGLAACRTTSSGPANVYTFREGTTEVESQISDSSLHNGVEIRNAIVKRSEDRLFVQFDVWNTFVGRKELEYKVDFFDVNGLRVDTLERWKPMTLGGGSVETVSLAGPTAAVNHCRLQLRIANTVR